MTNKLNYYGRLELILIQPTGKKRREAGWGVLAGQRGLVGRSAAHPEVSGGWAPDNHAAWYQGGRYVEASSFQVAFDEALP